MVDTKTAVPSLPAHRGGALAARLSCAAAIHALAFVLILGSARLVPSRSIAPSTKPGAPAPVDVRHIVFIARGANPGGGGGGGGNGQTAPIRHAQGIGHDSMTVRIAKPLTTAEPVPDVVALPALVLDALPLASGSANQVGLPVGGVSFGTSTGPGSGGGVGEGVGTGIGSGRGPGLGPGTGGGVGGGVYRPGGAVAPPRVITRVQPTYSPDALLQRIQGTVVLELVVQADGRPADIRVTRSLDPGGLDEQAIIAIQQWRFEPGRLNGKPVDVLVNVMLDFWIR